MVLNFIITKLHGKKTHYPIRQGRQKQISCWKATNFAKVHLEKNESYGKNKESENDRQVGGKLSKWTRHKEIHFFNEIIWISVYPRLKHTNMPFWNKDIYWWNYLDLSKKNWSNALMLYKHKSIYNFLKKFIFMIY